MDVSSMLDALEPILGAGVVSAGRATDRPTIIVPRGSLLEVARTLKKSPRFAMTLLTDVVGVDYLPREPRFEVVYHLTSVDRRLQVRLKVLLSGSDPSVPTVTGIWKAAGWLEREVWDLFGIVFTDHPDLTRLLMPEDWEGHPLRKDYPVQIKQPVSAHQPLQVSEEEFWARIERDRRLRP